MRAPLLQCFGNYGGVDDEESFLYANASAARVYEIHIAVDSDTHEVIAIELSLPNVTCTEVLPNFASAFHCSQPLS